MSKKAQVTLFIILAIAIVIVLLIIFFPGIKTIVFPSTPQENIKGCVEDAANEVIETIALQGGSLNPENHILFQGDKIGYLCYTNEYHKKCVMQKPLLKQDIEEEILSHVAPKAKTCIQNLKSQLERGGSTVSLKSVNTEISIVPNAIKITVDSPMTVTKESTASYNTFRGEIRSNLYDLIMISSSIANWEARFGDSDTLTYMLYYPDIKVEKKKQGDGSTIYILTDRVTNEKFVFASRSLVLPPGYVG